jgi:spore coat polysaccharide biosynthesis protein SpsF (cytidylyltransferase family)
MDKKFKYVATFLSQEGADYYSNLQKVIGYDVRVLKQKSPYTGSEQWVVYQTREKVR